MEDLAVLKSKKVLKESSGYRKHFEGPPAGYS